MNQLRVAAIVEGHGEYQSIRLLLTRIWTELLGGAHLDILRPIRHKRHQLVKENELKGAIRLAASKLAHAPGPAMPSLIMILLDADEDRPCELAPRLLAWAKEARADLDIVCIAANVEYETWFVAVAESLRKYLNLPANVMPLDAPEQHRLGKGWVERNFIGGSRYSETQDQPAMTAAMDIALCRARSPSFDKLCRELEKRRTAEA